MNTKATFKQIKGDYRFGGLDLEAPEDPRQYLLSEFGGVPIGKAPVKEFFIPNEPPCKDQFQTDFCVSMETSYTVEQDYAPKLNNFQQRLAAAFNFAATKRRYYNGDYSGFGLSIPFALGSAQHDGIPLEHLYPMYKTYSKRNYMANHHNISDEAWQDAATRKMDRGYFKLDLFRSKSDNFAAGCYHYKELVITGLYWYGNFYVSKDKQLILDKRGGRTGHCVAYKGFDIHPTNGRRRNWFKDSYLNHPEWWIYDNEVTKVMYNGYIVLPAKFTMEVIKIIQKYAGKAIMSENKPGERKNINVYMVLNGEKRKLNSEMAAWAQKVRLWQDVLKIPNEELAIIPTNHTPLKPKDGEIWPILKELVAKYKIEVDNKDL